MFPEMKGIMILLLQEHSSYRVNVSRKLNLGTYIPAQIAFNQYEPTWFDQLISMVHKDLAGDWLP